MAKVLSINISETKGTRKHPLSGVVAVTEKGIEGDAHAGDWTRQVTLLDRKSVEKMVTKTGRNFPPGSLAENIDTEGIEMHNLPIGTQLLIGDVILEISQIGKDPEEDSPFHKEVGISIMLSEGIFTRVIKPGNIKAGDEVSIVPDIRAAVITMSDKGHAGIREDRSGPALIGALMGKARVEKTAIVPDDLEEIKALLIELCDSGKFDVIFTTGGTGFSPRDVTPEATKAVIERHTPGITEAIRQASMAITPRAMLSRATAGIRKRTLIVNLPGSPKGAVESIEIFLPVMAHAVETLRGDTYECGRPQQTT